MASQSSRLSKSKVMRDDQCAPALRLQALQRLANELWVAAGSFFRVPARPVRKGNDTCTNYFVSHMWFHFHPRGLFSGIWWNRPDELLFGVSVASKDISKVRNFLQEMVPLFSHEGH